MQPIPPGITILYDAALVEKGVPLSAHFHYRKWLRYYLDFCLNDHLEPAKNESFAPFAIKLKDKNQSEEQRKQAFDAVSIYYQIEKGKPDQDGALLLKNKNEHISIKNIETNSTHADWSLVYKWRLREINRLRVRILIIKYSFFQSLDPAFELFILFYLFGHSLVPHGNGGSGYIAKVLSQIIAAQVGEVS